MFNSIQFNKCREENDFVQHLITSDDAHFHLSGYVNKLNLGFGVKNTHKSYMKHTCTVSRLQCGAQWPMSVYMVLTFRGRTWCSRHSYCWALQQHAIIFFIPELQQLGLTQIWMQQYGATGHTARLSMATLRQEFPRCLISRFGDIHWSSRSLDLTPSNYFLWGYLKERVYVGKPCTALELK
jgi:hypothetical protein